MTESARKQVLTLVMGFGLIAVSVLSCTNSQTASCDGDDDCFTDEVCDDGYCRVDDEGTSNSGDRDGGGDGDGDAGDDTDDGDNNDDPDDGGQDGEEDGGQDSGDDDCSGDLPCDQLVNDDVYSSLGIVIEPEDYSGYGCPSGVDDSDFIATDEPVVFDARACRSDDTHTYRVKTSTCREHDFVVHIDLEPRDDTCLFYELSDFEILVGSVSQECDGDHTTECYVIDETPATSSHGGYSWKVILERESSTAGVSVRLQIDTHSGKSFPYRVDVEVEKTSSDS